jgi:GT2 family glycosyltransferase
MEVIVVDGASFDGCDAMLATDFPAVVFIQSPDNVGFARANNLGVRHSQGEYLLFLNPDTLFVENTARSLLEMLEADDSVGAIGCRLLNRDHSVQTSCVQSYPTVVNQLLDSEWLRKKTPKSRLWGMAALFGTGPSDVEVLSGACIMMPRRVYDRVGGFTEAYFMYGEDLDLCYKVRRAGFRVVYNPATSLVHFGGGSTARTVSTFSVVMMRSSIHRFLTLHRGRGAAARYRLAMLVSALGRMAVLWPLLLLGRQVVTNGTGSWQKWLAVLRWSLAREKRLTTSGPATDRSPAALGTASR